VTPNLLTFCVLLGLGLMYWFPIRRWYLRWGATGAEIERSMLGDAGVPHTTYVTTLAVTVEAPAADIWPWLVQLGYRRGGLYSYDWLDRLFGFLDAPSAERIIPEFHDSRLVRHSGGSWRAASVKALNHSVRSSWAARATMMNVAAWAVSGQRTADAARIA
jgi:hypothetical protein